MKTKYTKIQEIYLSLSNTEKDEIKSLLQIDFFNQSQLISNLHETLSSHEVIQRYDKKEIYNLSYRDDSAYNDLNLRVSISKLMKLVERYLLMKNVDKFPLSEVEILTQFYKSRNLEKNYHSFFALEKKRHFDSYEDYLQYQYNYANRKLEYINFHYAHDQSKLKKQIEEIFEVKKELKYFRTLALMCDVKSFQQKYISDSDMEEYHVEIEKLNKNRDNLDLMLSIYLYVYYLYIDPKEENFLEVKQKVFSQEIPYKSNLQGILSHLQNFCIRFVNSGKTEYLSHLFDLYELRLTLIKQEGELNSANFRNIVYCALQLDKIDWSEKFVEQYNQYMNKEERENAYNFNYARIFFEKKKYKSAMRQLLKVTYEDAFYATSARILLIKCYFELSDTQPLISCCSSLIQYLKRSKSFTKQRIENIRAFVKYTKLIQKNRLHQNQSYFKKLGSKIADIQTMEKEWLTGKCEELS